MLQDIWKVVQTGV